MTSCLGQQQSQSCPADSVSDGNLRTIREWESVDFAPVPTHVALAVEPIEPVKMLTKTFAGSQGTTLRRGGVDFGDHGVKVAFVGALAAFGEDGRPSPLRPRIGCLPVALQEGGLSGSRGTAGEQRPTHWFATLRN